MRLCEAVAGRADLFELHRRNPRDYPFLLQSVAGHPVSARYDLLFAFPRAHLALRGGRIEMSGVRLAGDNIGPNFFGALSQWARAEAAAEPQPDLPFAGGWFLLIGYEAAGQVEPKLRLPRSPFGLPDALAVRCPAAAVYDRERERTWLVVEDDPAQLAQLQRDLAAAQAGPRERRQALTDAAAEEDPVRFLSGVRRIGDYLRAGDVFQVNLSRAWRARLRDGADYSDIYRQLRQTNPAPFAGLARWGDAAVLSSSPERLVCAGDGIVETRPIAGTRPRGRLANEDHALRTHLVRSVKERAEHIMLIDLERNDLGRVCRPGTIEVSELMTVESYAHVHHIVSNVRGALRPDAGPGEILRAVFPGGTITGCPKVRAMEIIAELEGAGRGPYTGAMGYLGRDGRLDANILIRTLVCDGDDVTFRAGAGIVADSRPERELAETRAKAKGLLQALGHPA